MRIHYYCKNILAFPAPGLEYEAVKRNGAPYISSACISSASFSMFFGKYYLAVVGTSWCAPGRAAGPGMIMTDDQVY